MTGLFLFSHHAALSQDTIIVHLPLQLIYLVQINFSFPNLSFLPLTTYQGCGFWFNETAERQRERNG
jgi:hypothetical protein